MSNPGDFYDLKDRDRQNYAAAEAVQAADALIRELDKEQP